METNQHRSADLQAKLDVILHPLRFRIAETIADTEMTAGQIGAAIPDVPTTTLYRHLNLLTKSGYLTIVREIPIRGTVEKVYTLARHAFIGRDEARELSRDEWVRISQAYVGSLIGEFARYFASDDARPVEDICGMRKIPIDLPPEEFEELVQKIGAMLAEARQKPAGPGSRRWNVGLSVVPVYRPAEPALGENDEE